MPLVAAPHEVEIDHQCADQEQGVALALGNTLNATKGSLDHPLASLPAAHADHDQGSKALLRTPDVHRPNVLLDLIEVATAVQAAVMVPVVALEVVSLEAMSGSHKGVNHRGDWVEAVLQNGLQQQPLPKLRQPGFECLEIPVV